MTKLDLVAIEADQRAMLTQTLALVDEVRRLNAEIEQLQVQLAGCSTAALGATRPEHVAVRGQYGWSVPYQDVLDLRRSTDGRVAEAKERGRREERERIIAWLRDRAEHHMAELAEQACGYAHAASALAAAQMD